MNSLSPAYPPGGAGLFLAKRSVHVIVDYQNVHLTAHDLFATAGSPKRVSQIHPLLFAEQVVRLRARRGGPDNAQAVLSRVHVFRGQPKLDREPRMHHVTSAQRAEWSRDSRVKLTFRPLKYPPMWPAEPAREKGIDVEVALALVTTAEDVRNAVVILATHDTDLEPALRVANERKGDGVLVETAGWDSGRRLGRHLRLAHTRLGPKDYLAARDPKRYTIRRRRARTSGASPSGGKQAAGPAD